jgi:hypothetical protein
VTTLGCARLATAHAGTRTLHCFHAAFERPCNAVTAQELEDLSNAAVRRFHACRRQLDEPGQKAIEAALVELPPALVPVVRCHAYCCMPLIWAGWCGAALLALMCHLRCMHAA